MQARLNFYAVEQMGRKLWKTPWIYSKFTQENGGYSLCWNQKIQYKTSQVLITIKKTSNLSVKF